MNSSQALLPVYISLSAYSLIRLDPIVKRSRCVRNLINRLWPLLFLILFSTQVSAHDFPEPKIVKINEKIVVLLGPIQHANRDNLGYMINSTVLIGDRGAVLIGSGGSDEVGWHIKKTVQKTTSKPVTHVINTHFHGDHYLGNSAFSEATIISSEKCREMVLQTGDEWVALMEGLVGQQFPNTRPIPAHVTYPEGKSEVLINGMRIVIWVPKDAHSPGDLMIYLPDEKVLIAGDILVNGLVPTLQDGNLKNWSETLQDILTTQISTYIPGHGDLMTFEQVKLFHRQLQTFYNNVKAGYLKGLDMDDMHRTLDLSAWEKLERAYVIKRNIHRAYLEIEQEYF